MVALPVCLLHSTDHQPTSTCPAVSSSILMQLCLRMTASSLWEFSVEADDFASFQIPSPHNLIESRD
jgi:hypothetical protein